MTEKLPNVDNRGKLLNHISSQGIASRQCVEELLSFIYAPPHLKGLSIVCTHLLLILPKISLIIKSEGSSFDTLRGQIDTWLRIAGIISKGWEHDPSSLRGEYTGPYSLYAALWHSPKKSEHAEKYADLMAILCVALKKLRHQEARGESYPSSKYVATLRARQLTQTKFEAELRSLPPGCRTLHQYFAALDKDRDRFQHDIWVLLDYAVNGKAGIRRTSDGRLGAQSVVILAEDPPGEDDEDGQTVQRIQLPQNNQKRRNVLRSLASPAEFTEGGVTFQFASRKSSPEAGDRQTVRQDAFEVRKLARLLAVKNQLLPCRWDALTSYEAAVFLEAVQDLMKTKRIAKVPGPELAAFLSVMFWMSARLEAVCKFRVYARIPSLRLGNGYIEIERRGAGAAWIINPPLPVGYNKPPRRRFKAIDSKQVICLPVPEPADRILRHYLDHLPPEKRFGLVFNRGEAEYRSAITDYFHKVCSTERLRLSPTRVADYMFNKLMCLPGCDIVTAMLATGRAHFLGFVPMHYTAIEIHKLRTRYSEACRMIISESSTEIGVYENSPTDSISAGMTEKAWTGSRYCPLSGTVSALVTKMKKLLSEDVGASSQITDYFRLHNRMVTYTTLMIGFATGYRSIEDPFLRRALIDRSTGFAVINDKDNDRSSHSRIIWVPEMVLDQIDCYHRHLAALSRRIITMNRSLYYGIRAGLEEAHAQPVLFFIRKDMSEIPARQKKLEDLYEYRLNCTIPSNANRHYLRTNLLRASCPSDVINAFMGHWSHGKSPWGAFSTMSPQRYMESLKQFLLPILSRDGWEAMSGLGAEND